MPPEKKKGGLGSLKEPSNPKYHSPRNIIMDDGLENQDGGTIRNQFNRDDMDDAVDETANKRPTPNYAVGLALQHNDVETARAALGLDKLKRKSK